MLEAQLVTSPNPKIGGIYGWFLDVRPQKKGRTAEIRRQLDPFAYGMRMRMRLAITAGKPEAIEGEVHQTVEDCPSTCPCPCRFERLSAWENAVTIVRPDPRFSHFNSGFFLGSGTEPQLEVVPIIASRQCWGHQRSCGDIGWCCRRLVWVEMFRLPNGWYGWHQIWQNSAPWVLKCSHFRIKSQGRFASWIYSATRTMFDSWVSLEDKEQKLGSG